jgi:hypothetical protein
MRLSIKRKQHGATLIAQLRESKKRRFLNTRLRYRTAQNETSVI